VYLGARFFSAQRRDTIAYVLAPEPNGVAAPETGVEQKTQVKAASVRDVDKLPRAVLGATWAHRRSEWTRAYIFRCFSYS
jgi:hypothetical protein